MKKSYVVVLLIFILTSMQAQKNKLNLLIGTYTNSCESKGIYTYDFDANTGDFNFKNATENVVNPSYLTVSKNNNYVYSVNENGAESTVSSFGYNPSSGKLDLINNKVQKEQILVILLMMIKM